MKKVKNMIISDGVTYSGATKSDGNKDIPHGMGICKYRDHTESGRFQNGELMGLAYLNYYDWMYVGVVNKGVINGWGINANLGKIVFGIYKDSVLRVNLTQRVEKFWSKILEEIDRDIQKNPIMVQISGNILVGAFNYPKQELFGFYFLSSGEVFIGRGWYQVTGITGKFLHFGLDYKITRGEYHYGELVREIDDWEFLEECHIDDDLAYFESDICDIDCSSEYMKKTNAEADYMNQVWNLIPDYSFKAEQMEEEWKRGLYYCCSLREYVQSLASGEEIGSENFFGWLFSNPNFNNSRVWSLPQNYRDAYFQFLNLFPSD